MKKPIFTWQKLTYLLSFLAGCGLLLSSDLIRERFSWQEYDLYDFCLWNAIVTSIVLTLFSLKGLRLKEVPLHFFACSMFIFLGFITFFAVLFLLLLIGVLKVGKIGG